MSLYVHPMTLSSSLFAVLRFAVRASEIARIVCKATVDELSTLAAGSDVHAVETRAKKTHARAEAQTQGMEKSTGHRNVLSSSAALHGGREAWIRGRREWTTGSCSRGSR